MGRSKKLRRKVLLISVFLMIFLVAYGDFMGIEVQAEQKQETMELVKPMEESQTVELQEKPGAEENSEGDAFEPETLQIISDAFLESYGEKYRPAQIYQYGTARYELQSLEQIKKEIPQKEQAVEETVQYTAVEQAEQLPETYHAWVKDQDTGVETEAELPVKDAEFTNWRWMDGFSLPITVQQYDAEAYYLGDQVVRAKEGDPFAAYGKELLKLAGLSPKYYKITSTRWEGGPWLGEDGYWYRKAEAEGEKYVADCEVIYGDVVMLPAETGYAWKAVYKKMPEITMDQTGSSEEEQKEMMEEMKKYSIMKTDACYAVDGKTHYSVMKETPVPKELKGLVTKNFIMAISQTFNTKHDAEIALQKLLQSRRSNNLA